MFSSKRAHDKTVVEGDLRHVLNQHMNILDVISDGDLFEEHEEIKRGSVIFRGSVGANMWISLSPLEALVGGYKSAMSEGDHSVVLSNSKKPDLLESAKKTRAALVAHARSLVNGMEGVLSSDEASSLEIYVRFQPPDPTNLPYEVQSSLHKELAFIHRHSKHHLSIIRVMMQHMNYPFDMESEVFSPPTR